MTKKKKNRIIRKKLSYLGPKFAGFKAPKLSGPRPAYSNYTKMNVQVRRGP
jgi:hypothetical protein